VFAPLLVDFLFRLTFGIAAAMAITSARDVTSGFFRVHLWVLMGVQTLAALATYSLGAASRNFVIIQSEQFWLAIAAAAASYIGAVIWMYERRTPGKAAIVVVAMCALIAAFLPLSSPIPWPRVLHMADRATSGMVLGSVTTAMLLGHWYLNTPTMKLNPLKRLIVLIAIAVGLRMGVCVAGIWLHSISYVATGISAQTWGLFLAMRWLSGLIGVLVLAWLTWQTLKIPNTQSATGILYAAVVLVFIGELTSQLLSAQSMYPV
jgi:hypothetical protein